MIDEPTIRRVERQECALVALVVPRNQIQHVMGPAIQEVMSVVSAQGIGPTGPVYSYHRKMDANTFDFEVGVPVSAPVTPTGRVVAGALRAALVATTIYWGPYEGLAEAWGEFGGWIDGQGRRAATDLWERYLTGPESGPDPSGWSTELNRPIEEQL